jgi:hypothetical protein
MSPFIGPFFTLRAKQAHISFIGLLPVCSVTFGYILDTQLFLLPQRTPHREHRNNSKYGNQVMSHSRQDCDSHAVLRARARRKNQALLRQYKFGLRKVHRT